MHRLNKVAIVLVIASVTASVWAAAPAEAGKPEPVLKRIPAGTMGFVVIRDVKGATDRVDGFLAEVGLTEMLKDTMPAGSLKVLRDLLMAGEGFDPSGGIALAMLDPKPFNLDLAKLAAEKLLRLPPAAEQKEVKLPFVIFIPGPGVKRVFPEAAECGKYMQVQVSFGPLLASELGGYVILSPMGEALDAVAAAQKSAEAELSANQKSAIERSDIAMHLNMTVTGPTVDALLKTAQGLVPGGALGAPGEAGLTLAFIGEYRDVLSQVQSATVGGRLARTGIVFEKMVAFLPDSKIGKAMLATSYGKAPPMDRLPDLPYVLAAACSQAMSPEAAKLSVEFLDKLLADPEMAKVPAEAKAKAKAILAAGYEQVSEVQFVIGGAPAGSGIFGMSCVMKCKDSQAVRGLLSECVDVTGIMCKALGGEDPKGLQALRISYAKDAEKVGDASVDAVVLTHPDMEEEKEDLGKVLGEQAVRFLVAAPDKNTVVVTFGGSKAFLAEALKVACAPGVSLTASDEAKEALSFMPANSSMLMLFSVGNLFDVLAKAGKVMDPEGPPSPFRLTTRMPIAIGAAASGATVQATCYLPNDLVKEIVGIFKVLFTRITMPPAEGGMPGGWDF